MKAFSDNCSFASAACSGVANSTILLDQIVRRFEA